MDGSFPAKCFKSNKMINRATSGSEATLHISEHIVGFNVPDKFTVDDSFHGFTYATCQRNRTIIGRFVGSLPGFRIGMISEGKLPDIQILLKIFKSYKREDFGKCIKS